MKNNKMLRINAQTVTAVGNNASKIKINVWKNHNKNKQQLLQFLNKLKKMVLESIDQKLNKKCKSKKELKN